MMDKQVLERLVLLGYMLWNILSMKLKDKQFPFTKLLKAMSQFRVQLFFVQQLSTDNLFQLWEKR